MGELLDQKPTMNKNLLLLLPWQKSCQFKYHGRIDLTICWNQFRVWIRYKVGSFCGNHRKKSHASIPLQCPATSMLGLSFLYYWSLSLLPPFPDVPRSLLLDAQQGKRVKLQTNGQSWPTQLPSRNCEALSNYNTAPAICTHLTLKYHTCNMQLTTFQNFS